MYQALYRKWRPQTFDEVIGQKHITETLKNQVRTDRLSHAYIFIGTRGTGKTTCARILAKAVNCESPVDGNPCGQCAACRSIAEGSAVDIVELDAASNNGVDNVRALREEAMFSPAELKKRVYIIDEVHMLSTSAFNALLKILEEPPKHLMFILATTELQKVPATILSRCQRHSFKRIDAKTLTDYVEYVGGQEHFRLEHDAAELIARLAEGGVRDAMSLLDQCSAEEHIDIDAVYNVMGLAGNRRVAELFAHIIAHDTESAVTEFNAMWMDGKDPSSLLSELSGLMRDVLMAKVAPRGGRSLLSGSYDSATLRGFADRLTNEELLCALDTAQRYIADMRGVKNPKTAAELCIVSLSDNTLGESVKELRARISRLEEMLQNGVPAVQAAPVQNAPPPREERLAPVQKSVPAPVQEEYPFEPDDIPEPPRSDTDFAPYVDEPPLEVYQEEQPEDAFIAKRETAQSVKQKSADPIVSWVEVRSKAKEKLPFDVRGWIDNEKLIYGRMESGVFNIYAEPNFRLGRINNPAAIKIFSDTVSAMLGKSVNARVLPMPEEASRTRSLDELSRFPEVRFIK